MKYDDITFKKPGQRIIKSMIAVFFAMLISHVRSEFSMPLHAAITSIICLQQGVQETESIGINRILGSIIGGFMGLLYLLAIERFHVHYVVNYLVITFVIGFLIYLLATLKLKKAITITIVVFLSITVMHGGADAYPYQIAVNRVIDTLVGVFMSILINRMDFTRGEKKSHD